MAKETAIVVSEDYEYLGKMLGLSGSSINEIRRTSSSNDQAYEEVLKEWIRVNTDISKELLEKAIEKVLGKFWTG